MAAAETGRERNAGSGPWRKLAFALLTLAYFLYFNWNGLWARFAADDMMNMVGCWRPAPARLLLDALLPWHGAYRPMAGLFYLPLHHFFGLNPLPYHAVMLAILLGNLYLVYRFALRIGCGELQAGLATLLVAYHAGLSMLYYNTSFIYDVLCFAFYMGAFLCYARVRAQGRLLRGSDTALVMGLYLCALDSKEMALTLPIVLLAYEWIYGDGWPAAWTRKGIAAWLRGPERVVLYCVVLNLLYLDGKVFGSDALTQNAAYRPDLSLHRVFEFEKTAMGDLFLSWDTFNSLGVAAVWVLVAWLAWRRPRPVLRFCWVFLMLTPLPLAVLEGRGAACLYIPLAGWAAFAAVVLTDVASRAARFLAEEPVFRRAGYAGLFAAILCTSFYLWAKKNDYLRRQFARVAMADLGKQTADAIQQLRTLNPHVKSNTDVVFLHDPFEGWDMSFIAELWFCDKTLRFHLQSKVPLSPQDMATMTVFDFQNGRLVQVSASPAPANSKPDATPTTAPDL
jgi:hypothetical protein